MGSKKPPHLGAFGNPLLDYIISVNDPEENTFVNKYGLSKHDSMELDTIGSGLFDEIVNRSGSITISPGGCSLNTSRVLQWLNFHRPGIVTFFGSVGRDERCFNLKKLLIKDGVSVRLNEVEDYPTGHCIVLANGQERTLVANVGAANIYTLKNLIQHETLLKNLPIFYVEGFFLTHSPEASFYLANLSKKHNKIFTFNLCGSYVCQEREYVTKIIDLFPKINVLFGNAFEFEALDKTSIKYGLQRINFFEEMSSIPEEEVTPDGEAFHILPSSQLVIITDGPRDILCLDLVRRRKMRVPVKRIPSDEIKDTVGAGDSFIAGYLSGIIAGKSNKECVQQGIMASQIIIRQNGVTLPGQRHD